MSTEQHIENLMLKKQILQLQAVILEMQHKEIVSQLESASSPAKRDADAAAHNALCGIAGDSSEALDENGIKISA